MRMSVRKYRVKLTTEERQELKALVSRGRAAAYKQTHGRILLLSDEAHADGAMKDEEIARALRTGCSTVERVRRRCVERVSARPWNAGCKSGDAGRSWTVRGKPTPYPVRGRLWLPWPAENRPFGSAQGMLRDGRVGR